MAAYYNEFDPYAAQWLRNLIAAGHIAPGDVDERSILDVRPDDLKGYTQCHFFAGIGGWSFAARLAGWPDERPLWTGSCPCQPFSAAGKRGGVDDERHLWPTFFELIRARRPAVVMGEQVASKDGLAWLDAVFADLEGSGYVADAVDLCAAGVGAPHIRQRLWWIGERMEHATGDGRVERRDEARLRVPGAGSGFGGMADAQQHHRGPQTQPADHGQSQADRPADWAGRCGGAPGGMADDDRDGRQGEPLARLRRPELYDADGRRSDGGVAEPHGRQRNGLAGCEGSVSDRPAAGWVEGDGVTGRREVGRPGPTNGLWRDADWLFCRDGKWRPVEPGTFPLAHGVPARVGRLRAYGNAIVPQVAAEVIRSFMDWQEHELLFI